MISKRETLRVSNYIKKRTTDKHPDWKKQTEFFYEELLLLLQKHERLNIRSTNDDGVYIKYDGTYILYLHFAQKHFLTFSEENYMFYGVGKEIFLAKHIHKGGSWTDQWHVRTSLEVDNLLNYLTILLKSLDQGNKYTPEMITYLFPNEIDTCEKFIEGKPISVLVNIYERDIAARTACLDHYGSNCAVCYFDFFATFGEIGRGFIHVHHKYPLSYKKDEYEVDPINDLIPVCPNCHAMLHSTKPPLTITRLKEHMKVS